MNKSAIRLLAPALLMACGGPDDTDVVQVSSDVRIDGADQSSVDPDSSDAKMCVNDDGHVFAIWLDDRDGEPDVWFNRSLDQGISWLPTPIKVNRGSSDVFAPDIACNDENVYVVWEDDRDGELENHQIYFSRSNDGGETWLDQDILLEDDDDGISMSLGPDITAVGSSVYVAWYDSANGAYDIFVAASVDFGTTWDLPVRVDSDDPAGTAYSASPRIAATEAGQVYVVWEDSRNGEFSDIYFARSDNSASSFKEDERLDVADLAGESSSFSPYLAADGNNVYVVWHDARGGDDRDIYMNYSANGGADWLGADIRLDSGPEGFFNSLYPVAVVDGATAHVAWQDAETGYDIFYRKVVAGSPGDEEIRLDNGDAQGASNSLNTKIALGEGGAVVVAWEDGRGEAESGLDNGYNDLYYNFDDGEGFLPESDLRIDSMEPGQSFKIDVNIAIYGGLLYTAWIDGRNGTSDVYFHSLAIGEESTYVEPAAEAGQ